MAEQQNNLNDISLLKVFSFISTSKLIKLAVVCKKWNELIKEVLAKRQADYFVALYVAGNKWIDQNGAKMVIKKDDFINEYKIFLLNYHMNLTQNSSILVHFLTPDFGYGEKSIITNYEISDPNSILKSNTFPVIKSRVVLKSNVQLISRLLPNHLRSLYVIGDSILADNLKEYTGNTTQKNWSNNLGTSYTPVKPAITSLLLESDESYRFETKQLINQVNQLSSIKTEADLKKFFSVNQNESIRLVLMFISDFYRKDEKSLQKFIGNLKQIRKLSNDELVIAGCYINECVYSNNQTDYVQIDSEITFLTLISKNEKLEHVKIAQMMLPGPNDEVEPDSRFHPDHPDYPEHYHLKEKMKLLKQVKYDDDSTDYKTFAIVSRSLRRTNEIVDDNLELFRKEFPQVKLIGIKGKYKIGHDNYPGVPKENPNQVNQINYDVDFYGFNFMDSSIFTVISLKE